MLGLVASLCCYFSAYWPLPAYLRLPADAQPCIPPGDPEARPSSALPATVVGDDMRRGLEHTQSDLARSNAELSRLHQRCRRLERSLRDELKARDDEIDRLRQHLDSEDEQQARARTADTYLTRTDTWSGAQVLQAVHDINSEILQFAAAATEVCTFDRNARPSSSRAVQAMHDTSARLGQHLARILANRDHSLDPVLVQLALQGCLTLCVTRTLSAFCVGFPSKSDSLLHQIHHRMALAEPQPTSSKWRALTHQHIHAMYPSLTEYSITELTDTILRWSSDIFLIAGCLTYEPTTSSSSPTATSLRSRFGEHIRRFSKSVIHLAKVLREDILSTSFELIAIDPNDCKSSSSATPSNGLSGPSFHERTMVDAFSGYGHSHGCVLATMELGLRCVTRIGTREGVGSEEEVLLEQRVLLMPKVVLESVLDVLDQ